MNYDGKSRVSSSAKRAGGRCKPDGGLSEHGSRVPIAEPNFAQALACSHVTASMKPSLCGGN